VGRKGRREEADRRYVEEEGKRTNCQAEFLSAAFGESGHLQMERELLRKKEGLGGALGRVNSLSKNALGDTRWAEEVREERDKLLSL